MSSYHEDSRQNGGAVAWTAIAVMFWLIVATVYFILTTGCAHDNGIVYKPAPKPTSTVAENIEAGGKVAAGAFDRLFKSEK